MVANFAAGGAAVSVLARQAGARLVVVDAGVAAPLDASRASSTVARRRERPNMRAGRRWRATWRSRALVGGHRARRPSCATARRRRARRDGHRQHDRRRRRSPLRCSARRPSRPAAAAPGLDDAGLARKVDVVERVRSRVEPTQRDPHRRPRRRRRLRARVARGRRARRAPSAACRRPRRRLHHRRRRARRGAACAGARPRR